MRFSWADARVDYGRPIGVACVKRTLCGPMHETWYMDNMAVVGRLKPYKIVWLGHQKVYKL